MKAEDQIKIVAENHVGSSRHFPMARRTSLILDEAQQVSREMKAELSAP
jgi:hypothetical protein